MGRYDEANAAAEAGKETDNNSGRQGSRAVNADFDSYLHVAAIDGAPDDLVQLGIEYWRIATVDEYGNPQWAAPTSQLVTDGLGAIHHIAAAAVRATVPGAQCQKCGQELIARTRSDFTAVKSGGQATCVPCDAKYVVAAAQVRAALNGEKHVKAMSKRALDNAEIKWNEARLGVIQEEHKVELCPDAVPPVSSFEASVMMLSILRFSPFEKQSPGWIPPIERWTTPLIADINKELDATMKVVNAGLMKMYPSGLRTFVFEPQTFEAALAEAGGDVDKIAPGKLTGAFYPMRAWYYVPYGPSAGRAIELLDDLLSVRVLPPALDGNDRLALLGMIAEAIADEAVRYFNHQIEWNSLPPVPEEHVPRLRDAALKAAEYMPLGRIYVQAWRAAKDGAAAAHRYGLPNSPKMSTHAVNQFERFVGDRALIEGRPFGEVDSLPLAAVTRILFRNALDADPMTTAVSSVRSLLDSVELPDDGSWAWIEASEDVRAAVTTGGFSGSVIRSELTRMRTSWGGPQALEVQRRVADRLAEHYDLHLQRKNDRLAALETLDLATLLARADGDDSTAAQTVLLWLQDVLPAQRTSTTADSETDADAGEAPASIPEQRDPASTNREARRQRSHAPAARKGNSKKKRKRR